MTAHICQLWDVFEFFFNFFTKITITIQFLQAHMHEEKLNLD